MARYLLMGVWTVAFCMLAICGWRYFDVHQAAGQDQSGFSTQTAGTVEEADEWTIRPAIDSEATQQGASQNQPSDDAKPAPEELVDVQKVCPKIKVALMYASADNFVGEDMYHGATKAFLLKSAAMKLKKAQDFLDTHHNGYVILIKDAYRPQSVQKMLWNKVAGTPQEAYVANPFTNGSHHCRGLAVDVTLLGPDGKEVDMGTPVDYLGIEAEPRYESLSVQEGALNGAHVSNRMILRNAMTHPEGGAFYQLSTEWWHYNAFEHETCKTYGTLDVSLQLLAK